MRKLAILCLVVGIGIALAGTEQWIGPSPAQCYVIPNPEPGVYPEVPDVFRPAVDTFSYDDGMPGSAWAWNTGGNGWGVKFISPSDNITVAGALIHIYGTWPTPGDTLLMVKMFADDGPNGSPGTELFSSDTVGITRGQWNYIPIDQQVVGTNYYIFYVQVGDNPNCCGLSIDAFSNAPSHRKWVYSPTDGFSEDARRGDWLIQSVVDWSPQDNNAETRVFASNMPGDTTPNINLFIRAKVRNLGNSALPSGTPVRLHVTGPQSYTYDDTMTTSANLERGQQQQMNFSPAWRVPNLSGNYRIHVWTEAASEQYPGNDTITYDLSIAQWIEYCNYNSVSWLTWAGPQRVTKFDPSFFGLQYPVGLSRMRTQFYWHPTYPWPDSSFQVKVYDGDGSTLLYESGPVEAPPGTPGPMFYMDFDSTLIFESGEFYVGVDPVHGSGHPSTVGSDTVKNRSFYGSPGSWLPWNTGELCFSASVQGGVGLAEGRWPRVLEPTLGVANYPNPAGDFVNVRWQIPARQQTDVSLYDATGRVVQTLYSGSDAIDGEVRISTRQLPAGIYLVRLETKDATATRKLVLEH